jgi:mono/diheme cytochrome c family protein
MERARASLGVSVFALAFASMGCDTAQSFHTPSPSWSRMLEVPRRDPYDPSDFFADGRAMRAPPPGTVPTEHAGRTRAEEQGLDADGGYVARIPVKVDRALLARGRAAFDETCATCHGVDGDGRSVVADKMTLRRPPSLHEPRIVAFAAGRLYQTLRNGYGLMPSYASMLDVRERWAVVAYVRALQLRRSIDVGRLPKPMADELRSRAP